MFSLRITYDNVPMIQTSCSKKDFKTVLKYLSKINLKHVIKIEILNFGGNTNE